MKTPLRFCLALFIAVTAGSRGEAGIVRIEITSREALPGNGTVAIAYETLRGRAYGEVDPKIGRAHV